MKKNKINLKFWTPGNNPDDDGATVGCATHGLCRGVHWANPPDKEIMTWVHALYGVVIAGTWKDVLERLDNLDFEPKDGLVFFAHADGMEEFLQDLNRKIGPLNLAGGAAARQEGDYLGEVIPAAEDVVLLLLDPDANKTTIEATNLHSDVKLRLEIRPHGSREIEAVRLKGEDSWQSGVDFYRAQQQQWKIEPDDFESLALTDDEGRNLHCAIRNNRLAVGANLPSDNRLSLCLLTQHDLQQKVAEKLLDTDKLTFCCAGLRAHLRPPVPTGEHSLCAFLFGEVVTFTAKPLFGNLMISRLRYSG